MKIGLDFGTTNSSISIARNGVATVIPVDLEAPDPRVARSMLFFFRRNLVYDPKMAKMRIVVQTFQAGDIRWEGEFKTLIGQAAINEYIQENRNRHPGIRRKIFTGRWVKMRDTMEAKTVAEPEYFEEVDYGTGRLLQALKSALRTSFKGTTIFGKFFTVEELVALFVQKIKVQAEIHLHESIDEMVIGRPVHFSEDPEVDKKAQARLAVAIRQAGIKKLKFEFEPVAAAKQFSNSLSPHSSLSQMAHPSESKTSRWKKSAPGRCRHIFIFDFGGGTLDTAIVKLGDKFEVLATGGVYIGGDLLNADIMENKLWNYFGASTIWGDQNLVMPIHPYQSLRSWYSIPSLNNPEMLNLLERVGYKNSDPKAVERFIYLIRTNLGFELYEAIEQAKKELSDQLTSRIIFQQGPIDLKLEITRFEFEEIIYQRVEEIIGVVLKTLKEAQVEPEQIDFVVRTGGSSLIPIFEHMLAEIFGKDKITIFETFTSIAAGLALE